MDHAARAVNVKGKRFSHQYRIHGVALAEAKSRLMAELASVISCSCFESLHSLLSILFKPVSGLGPLYIYDTTLRLSAFFNLEPTAVYLHAGTRIGARALGLDVSPDIVPVTDFPKPIQILAPHEIEDFLCIYKKHLSK